MPASMKWLDAQSAEREFWSGIGAEDAYVLRLLMNNREQAGRLQKLLSHRPERCVEIGVGGLSVGAIGFLPDVQLRVGIDPLPPVELKCADPLRKYVESLRAGVHFMIGCGEQIPVHDGTMDLVVCCNVLDHVRDAAAVLAEAKRIMRPGGSLYLEVDTFSLLGWLKWHSLTKHFHADEIMVRAHPYRFKDNDVVTALREHGFLVVHWSGHQGWNRLIGASRSSSFLATRH